MKKESIKKRKTIILLILTITFLGVVLVWHSTIIGFFRKQSLKIYLNIPTTKTIYEKNNNPHYKKTTIKIPKHKGYLIAVYKDQHKLKLYKNGNIVKEYDVNIKRELEDRKKWEDDQTPEGIFKIETLNIIFNPPWERWM